MKTCSVPGCGESDRVIGGLCFPFHYMRQRQGKTLTDPKQHRMHWSQRIEIDVETGCHLWAGATNQNGYGHVRIGGRTLYVHRVSAQ